MSLSKINGQKTAEGQFGTIKTPKALHAIRCLMVRTTRLTGGTSQLFSFSQFCVKQSIASEPGFQNFELYRPNLQLL